MAQRLYITICKKLVSSSRRVYTYRIARAAPEYQTVHIVFIAFDMCHKQFAATFQSSLSYRANSHTEQRSHFFGQQNETAMALETSSRAGFDGESVRSRLMTKSSNSSIRAMLSWRELVEACCCVHVSFAESICVGSPKWTCRP